MIYPLNIFSPDPVSKNVRPFIIFIAREINFNIMKMESWSDSTEVLVPKGGFVLPMPAGGLVDSVTNSYDNASSLVAEAAQKIIDAIPGSDLGQKLMKHGGIVPDPKLTQLYTGTTSRTWSGTWQLVPQSFAEALMVSLILKSIKQYAAPDKKDIKNKVGVLIQPYIFKIIFSNPLIHLAMQFDKMAITGYQINYFSTGYSSTYKDMMPKHIELRMDFAEFGIKTRQDWMI
ncbi:MAG: hypothetical protein ACYDD5_00230 [Sulfuricurvum sp.]